MKKFLLEFREFATKGNVMDLAIGVIIGGAFSAIVSSLVKDIIMPLLSLLIGRINITDLKAVIPGLLGGGEITLTYGVFLQAVINFTIVAFFIFLMIKLINKLHKRFTKEKEAAAQAEDTPESLSRTEKLLTEIRDLMKETKS